MLVELKNSRKAQAGGVVPSLSYYNQISLESSWKRLPRKVQSWGVVPGLCNYC